VLLVLRVSSAAVAEDAAAQEDTGTLWAALRAGGHVARNVLNICSLPSVVMHGEPSPPPHVRPCAQDEAAYRFKRVL
jgi:hypothetical protein